MPPYDLKSGKKKRFWVLPVSVLLAAFLLSLCFRTALPGFIPIEAAKNLYTAIRLEAARLLRLPLHLQRFSIIDAHPYFYETIIRLKNSFITACSGGAVCIGGALMQTIFRNPIASPNLLGISTGVNLGNMVFLFVYTSTALSMMERRFVYCYAFSALLVLLITGVGQLSGRRSGGRNIMDMLIIGTVISQFGSVFTLYLQYRLMEQDYELMRVFQELNMGIFVLTDAKSLLMFSGGLLVSLVPVLLLRYRMNAAAFPDEEARALGVRPLALRSVGLISAGILSMTALIHVGNLGMIAMVIPHLCRFGRGTDFRLVCLKSACYGGAVMLVCRSVCSMIFVAGAALPVNFAVSILVLPAFVFSLAKGRSAFA